MSVAYFKMGYNFSSSGMSNLAYIRNLEEFEDLQTYFKLITWA